MKALIIGGTRFIGRHIAEALQQRGHEVTLFNRGSNPGVHSGLEQVHGDRNTDLSRLNGRMWDAVIDTSGYTPDVVERSARYFESRTNRYLFISTISVYDDGKTAGPDEEAAVLELPPDADPAKFDVQHYGALKVLCERKVREILNGRSAIVRPGLVAGPHDPTDRFTYWPARFAEGGRILAAPRESRIQYIDVRDLAAFCVRLLESDNSGVYNCVTPAGSLTFEDLYDACARAANAEAEIIEPGEAFFKDRGVEPWSDLPLWIPRDDPSYNVTNTDPSRALSQGLKVRSIAETVKDVLEWARSASKRFGNLTAGLSPDRETQLLCDIYRVEGRLAGP